MTKLMQWLLALALLASIYFALVTKQIKHQFLDENELFVQLSPFSLIGLFGVNLKLFSIL